ncbi:cardiolipin synthase [Streptococcus dentiloxodontae]
MDKSRRGFLRGVFSRGTIIFILILIQVAALLSSYIWFQQYQIHLEIVELIMVTVATIYLINSDMDSTSVITWLLLILPFPFVGTLFLAYTRLDLGYRGMKRGLQSTFAQAVPYFKQDKEAVAELRNSHTSNYNLISYFERHGSFPVYRKSEVTYFPSGEAKFEAMKNELRKAEKYIFMEYFIIDEGLMWGEVLAILEQKVKEGVEVRVMYDGMIELSTLSFDYTDRLKKIGIDAKAFASITPFLSTYYNYRDHRKILVIDGKVAFTGGVNLADEYINKVERFGHWKDTAICVKGRAVDTFTLLFLQMWTEPTEVMQAQHYLPEKHESYDVAGFVVPYGDSPLDKDKVGENVYIDILNHARDYVHIMTPYLILDGELTHALKFAAERGVDVRIIMPGIPDKAYAYALAKTYYRTLVDSGVKIYEYIPGFVHAKVFVSDNQKAVVGTINLDYRSLYHHFECAAYMYQTNCIVDIEADFKETLTKCRKVTYETIKATPLKTKALGLLAKTVAPLM